MMNWECGNSGRLSSKREGHAVRAAENGQQGWNSARDTFGSGHF